MVIAFSLQAAGLERLMTTALSMRVSDRWINIEEICMRARKRVIPSPLIASTCTSLACCVVPSGTLLHVKSA